MEMRSVQRRVELPAGQNQAFDLLITPSDVRKWWGASRVIIVPKPGGVWVASWGDDEDHPEFVSAHTISRYEPPRVVELREITYYARASVLPFQTTFTTMFTVEPGTEGSLLDVRQDGFPADPIADEYYRACERGWERTLEQIRTYLSGS